VGRAAASFTVMGKAIVLVLIALGANANAEVIVAEMLADRASNNMVGEIVLDMDDATLAKPAKAGGGGAKTARAPKKAPAGRARTGAVQPVAGKFTPIKTVQQSAGRVFGGTNSRWNKDPAVMAKLKGKAAQMYGTDSGGRYTGGGFTDNVRFGIQRPESQAKKAWRRV